MPYSDDSTAQEIREHFAAGDSGLGLRRLLDLALDSSDLSLQRETLLFADGTSSAQVSQDPAHLDSLLTRLAKTTGIPAPATDGMMARTEALSKRYARGGFQLTDVSMTLQEGQITGLVGQNGHGKTTLLRLLAGELLPDSGSVHYPFAADAADVYELRTRLVYIEQRIPRWFGPLMDNLQFAGAHYHKDGETAALRAELLVARLGLRPYREHVWSRLSSGYRTRFEIARALMRQPRLLLLDEPLANLDIVAQQTLLQDLRFLSASAKHPFAMVLSSQHIYEVEKVSDNIIFLEKGQPRYQQLTGDTASDESLLVLEVESPETREAVLAAFGGDIVQEIRSNGGVFLITFRQGLVLQDIWAMLSRSSLAVTSLRDISNSARRFFAQS